MLRRSTSLTFATLTLFGVFALSSCAASIDPVSSPVGAPESTDVADEPDAEEELDAEDGSVAEEATRITDAMVERDQFMRDQGFPSDGSPLVASTPAQKEFIAQQRAHIEAQGLQWQPQSETIYLALISDACEASILNSHAIDSRLFEMHVSTSPLFDVLLNGLDADARAIGERNLASVITFGTSFLCPDDAPQWRAAYDEYYG